MSSIVKVSPFAKGVPDGGSSGDVLVRNTSIEDGYEWSSNVTLASDRIAKTPVEALTIPNDGNGDRFTVRISNNPKLQVYTDRVTTTVPVNGRDMSADGSKLDNIQANAQRNPTQISTSEKNSPTSVTSVRGFSPKDVKDMIDTHASSGGATNYPRVTAGEITNAGNTTDPRSFSPSDVKGIVDINATGEPNPNRVSAAELANPSASSTVRSFSPSDVNTLFTGRLKGKTSTQYTPDVYGNVAFTWQHGESTSPIIAQVYAICISSQYGYSVGDKVQLVSSPSTISSPQDSNSVTLCKNSNGQSIFVEGTAYVHHKTSDSIITANQNFWRIVVDAVWVS